MSNAGGKKKGFLGLEYLLFAAPGSELAPVLVDDAARARRLGLAVSMADEIAASARELAGAWELDQQGYIGEFEHPSLNARRYQSELDAVNDPGRSGELRARDDRGHSSGDAARPQERGHARSNARNPTRRSDNSVEDMQSSLAGFVAVYTTAAFTGAVQERSAALDAQVHSEISSSQVKLAAIPAPFASAVVDQTPVVQAAYDATQALKHTWNADVTSALGATFRVGDNDGD